MPTFIVINSISIPVFRIRTSNFYTSEKLVNLVLIGFIKFS